MSQIFGQTYANAYDRLYGEKDYDGETALLATIFQKYSARPVRNILDLGCGTGNHALRLATKGFQVLGVDRSADMLRIAEEKANERKIPLRLRQADLRELALGETFDAVLMMFAVLGYQVENADVLRALRTARWHLHENGILVFDIWYGPAVLAQRPGDRVRTIGANGATLLRTSSSKLNVRRQVCSVDFRIWHIADGRILEESSEGHPMRYFFPQELELFLQMAGFRLLRLGAFPDFDHDPDETTWNAMIVADAISDPLSSETQTGV